MIITRDMYTPDYARVREHLAKCWRDTYSHHMEPSDVKHMLASLDEKDLGLIAPDGVALVAEDAASAGHSDISKRPVIGTVFAVERHNIGYIWGLYTAIDRKRSGVGTLLMDKIQSCLSGASQLSVTVLDASSDANAFYKALGFKFLEQCSYELFPGKLKPASIPTFTR